MTEAEALEKVAQQWKDQIDWLFSCCEIKYNVEGSPLAGFSLRDQQDLFILMKNFPRPAEKFHDGLGMKCPE